MDSDFSQKLFERIWESQTASDPNDIDLDLIKKSSIKVKMDVTNQHIAFTLQLKFVEAFENFMKQVVSIRFNVLMRNAYVFHCY